MKLAPYALAAALAVFLAAPALAGPIAPGQLDGCQFNSAAPTLSDGQAVTLQCDSTGKLQTNTAVTISGVTVAVGVTPGTAASTNPLSNPMMATAITAGGVVYGAGNLQIATQTTGGSLNVNVTGGSLATNSSFSATFPTTGTAIGAKNGANMVSVNADSTGNLNTDLQQVAGAAIALGQAAMASSLPVVIANNQTPVATTVTNTIACSNCSGTTPTTGGTNADGVLSATPGFVPVENFNMIYNGATWDRRKGIGGVAMVAVASGVTQANSATPFTENMTQVGGATYALGAAGIAAAMPVNIANNQTPAVNLQQVGGATLALGQAAMASSVPVAIANNQTPVATTVTNSITCSNCSGTTPTTGGSSPTTGSIPVTPGFVPVQAFNFGYNPATNRYDALRLDASENLQVTGGVTPGTGNGTNPLSSPILAHVVTSASTLALTADQLQIPGMTTAGGLWVVPQAVYFGGATGSFHLNGGSAVGTNSTLVAAGQHTLYSLTTLSTTTTAGFLRLYDSATAPTCSSATNAKESFPIPASSTTPAGWTIPIGAVGWSFTNGIAFCMTGGGSDTDNTGFGNTGTFVNFRYQ